MGEDTDKFPASPSKMYFLIVVMCFVTDCRQIIVDNSSSVHDANINKDIFLIIGKGRTNELNDTTVTAEGKYSINFTEQQSKCFRSTL